VRGYKHFLPQFPHEVGDLQPVLDTLGDQNPKDSEVRTCCTFSLVFMSPAERADEQWKKNIWGKKCVKQGYTVWC